MSIFVRDNRFGWPHAIAIQYFVMLCLKCSTIQASQACFEGTWEPIEVLGLYGSDQEVPFPIVRDRTGQLRLFAVDNSPQHNGRLKQFMFVDGRWISAPDPPSPDSTELDMSPAVSIDSTNLIHLAWVRRYGPGESDAKLMTATFDGDRSVWSAARQIRDNIAWHVSPAMAAVDPDSVWYFFQRGTTLRAKATTGSVPGKEYIVQNSNAAAYAFSPVALRRADGSIVVVWSSLNDEWPIRYGEYITFSYLPPETAMPIPSPNGAANPRIIEDKTGRLWLSYINSLRVGQALVLMSSTDGYSWSWPVRVAGYDGGRNCRSGALAFWRNQLLIVYDCEARLLDGTFDRGRFEIEARTYRPDFGFCPPMELAKPLDYSDQLEQTAPTLGIDQHSFPVIAFGQGPQVWHKFKTLYLAETVALPSRRIELRQSIGRSWTLFSAFDSGVVGPCAGIVLGRNDETGSWRRILTVEVRSDVAEQIHFDDASSEIKAQLYSLHLGTVIAETGVIKLDATDTAQSEWLTVNRTRGRAFQVCRRPGVVVRELVVFNLAGRRVDAIPADALKSDTCIEWNPRTSSGGHLALGTYFLRASIKSPEGRERIFAQRIHLR